jgi:hypothetical protein
MGEKLKDLGRKQILEQLSLEQLKAITKNWWKLKPPYKTAFKTLKTKKDFVNFHLIGIYTKKSLITAIKKEAKVPIKKKRRLERLANHKCEACKQKLTAIPDIHHITPIDEGGSNSDNNLIVLCPTCHRKAHGKSYTRTELKKFIKKRKTK